MNEQFSKILIEKYKYMFSEMDKDIEIQRKQSKLTEELVKAKADDDEIKIAQIKEEQREVGSFYPIVFGFECDDGWFNLLDELMSKIKEVDKNRVVTIHQIKEKYGGLRFYTGRSIEEAEDIIHEYQEKSFSVCEVCGKPARLCVANNWYKVVCLEHRELKTWAGIVQHYKPARNYGKEDEVLTSDNQKVEVVSFEFKEDFDTWFYKLSNGQTLAQDQLKRVPWKSEE